MISIQSSIFGYKEPILQVESLEIESGSLTALIGKNGSGKSTFLKTICGILPTLKGNVIVGKKEISQCNEKERSQLVAFVGSSQLAIPYLSVKEFVLLGRSPHTGILGRYNSEDNHLADQMLLLFHLEHLKYRELAELSDGERQLAAFARAFAQETPVILMDEPTAFLDYGNKRLLLKTLKNATEELSKCVLLSTHDIDLCAEERIGILGINAGQRQMIFLPQGTTKEEMLQHFF
jgi:iron complex transport system ATP-binding protein